MTNPFDSPDPSIFDVQTHHVNPMGAWRDSSPTWKAFFESVPQANCGAMLVLGRHTHGPGVIAGCADTRVLASGGDA